MKFRCLLSVLDRLEVIDPYIFNTPVLPNKNCVFSCFLKNSKQLHKYPSHVLESTFRSSDLIQAVRNRLTEQLPYTEIELFTAPPKRVLQDDQTLYDLGFFTRGKINMLINLVEN